MWSELLELLKYASLGPVVDLQNQDAWEGCKITYLSDASGESYVKIRYQSSGYMSQILESFVGY
jgi:hypothetical protein